MRFLCKCGKILSNAQAPNDIELAVFTDLEWDNIINIGRIDTGDLPNPKFFAWRSPHCKRIYVFDRNQLMKYYVSHNICELNNE